MEISDSFPELKVIILGNGNVGKTSLLQKFVKNSFTPIYKKTIGVSYLETDVETNEGMVKFMLFDCAGQTEFDSISKDYYKNANCVILAFSSTDAESFKMIKSWRYEDNLN
jgi:small GTP-binding protein